MRAAFLLISTLTATTAMTACGSTGVPAGRFLSGGYLSASEQFAVRYNDPASHGLLSDEWRLDNYLAESGGMPTDFKTGPAYEVELEFDLEGDGKIDKKELLPIYELRFVYRRTDAVIFVRSLPLGSSLAEKSVSVLAQRYVEAAGGSGQIVVELPTGAKVTVDTGEPYATRVLSLEPMLFGAREAASATFEVASVSQLQMSQDARWQRGHLVLVKTGFSRQHAGATWPTLLVIGYVNRPEDFDATHADFEAFLSRVIAPNEEDRLSILVPELASCLPPATPPLKVMVAIESNGEATVTRHVSYNKWGGCLRSKLAGILFVPKETTYPIEVRSDVSDPFARIPAAYTPPAPQLPQAPQASPEEPPAPPSPTPEVVVP